MRMSSPLVLTTVYFIIIAACSRTAGSFSTLPSVRRRNNLKIAQRKVINVRTVTVSRVTVSRWRQNHRDHPCNSKSLCTTTTMMMQPADLADDDLIALPFDAYITSSSPTSSTKSTETELNQQQFKMRLCVIRNHQCIYPLIRHEDDVETDLFLDPRFVNREITLDDMLDYCTSNNMNDNDVDRYKYYGVGWYGQRPVPSLGGGPGYGAEADEVWSVDEDVLEEILNDSVDIPVIDVGMAHGEKARGGALF